MQNDLEETKKLIELNYTLRNQHPNMFIDRDSSDEAVQEFVKLHDPILLPGLTPEKYKLMLFRMQKVDPSQVNSLLEAKVFYMMADCRFTMLDIEKSEKSTDNGKATATNKDNNDEDNDDDDEYDDCMAEGDVHIVDMENYTFSHLMRASFFAVRAHMKFLQDAYPVRMRAMHVLNVPPFMDKMISFVRPFVRDEIFQLAHFHTEGIESLYEHVPRDMLPEEYGGKAGTIPELKEKLLKQLEEKRHYLMDPKHWRVEQTRSRWSWW